MTRSLPAAVLAAVSGAVLAASALVATPAGAASAPAPSVTLRAGSTPSTAPFPNDLFTTADAAQITGRRVDLPMAGCDVQGRSLCDDLTLINQLDGFDTRPRVTLPFTGAVDLHSVSADTVHIDGPNGFTTGLVQLTQDATTPTVAGYPDRYLSQDTTYTLVVGPGIRAANGTAVGGLPRSVSFTTMTTTGVLDTVRTALDSGAAYAEAQIPDGERGLRLSDSTGGGRSVFPAASVRGISKTDQVLVDPAAPGAFARSGVVNTAKTFGYFGFGSFLSPQYANDEAVIPHVPTTQTPAVQGNARLGVVMVAPAPSATCIQPVIFGHGYTDNKFDLFRAADTLGSSNLAVFSTDVLGHGFGPRSTWSVTTSSATTSGLSYGRGKDFTGDGRIESAEGSTPSPRIVVTNGAISVQPSPNEAASLRESLVQTAIDEMALVRVLEKGVDVDGDGTVDTCTGPGAKVQYYGRSWGGMYGALLLATDPHVEFGVLNVPGTPVTDIGRLGSYRSLLAQITQFSRPNLLNGGPGLNGFTEDIPLRRDPELADVIQGAVPLQESLARTSWVGRGGNPDAYATRLQPVPGSKNVIVQVAYGDGTVPNPTTNELLRAGNLYGKTWIYRADRTPSFAANPHDFLLDITSPAHFESQEQVRRFFASRGADERDPDGVKPFWEPATAEPVRSSDLTAISSMPSTDYPATLDCLHFPDPQTGAGQTRTRPATECPVRAAEVTPARGQPASRYVALPAATRILDSRVGLGTTKGLKSGRFTVELGGLIPDAAASSVVLNATRRGFVTVLPEGSPNPGTSNVNVEAAVPGVRANVQANEVVTRLSQHRRVDVVVDSTRADVIVDVVGYLTTTTAPGAGRVIPLTPQRVLDTRSSARPLRSGEFVVDLSKTVAATATSVILNVTLTRPDHRGHVVVFPTGAPRPATSNVNVEAGQTQANEVTVRLGTNSSVSLGVVDGLSTAMVVDLVGMVVEPTVADGRDYTALVRPRRLVDTRVGTGLPAGAKRGAVPFRLPADLPADLVGVLLNVTATGATGPGLITVFPSGTARPGTSNVNFVRGANQANEVLTAVGGDRTVIFDVSGRQFPATQLVVDMVGYLTAR